MTEKLNPNLLKAEYSQFFKLRDELKKGYIQEFYFLPIGIEYNNRNASYFITFNRELEETLKEKEMILDEGIKQQLLSVVRKYYNFIYIPVESKVKDVLKLENREMQALMDDKILEKIDTILNDKKFDKITGKSKESIIENVNYSLNNYMRDISDKIQEIDAGYSFNIDGKTKKNLTSADVRDKILEAYFAIRTLKKDKKEIQELSSGEQRLALIDIATAFLLKKDNGNTILAIDEPENSLHISKCFAQMERIRKLSENNQIIATTHWYGGLPAINKGFLIYLDKEDRKTIKFLEFKNLFEDRGDLPQDIFIKSYFELCSSILNSIRVEDLKWIICEGYDDKIYLDYYLKDKVDNLRVLSMGGCGNVIKLYKYLYLPFSEKAEKKDIKGKLLFIIDSDDVVQKLELNSKTEGGKMRIVRLQISNKEEFSLNTLSDPTNYPTEIEDCLEPYYLYVALKKTIEKYGNIEQKATMEMFDFNDTRKFSKIKGEVSILKPNKLEALEKKKDIVEFIESYENKYRIAEEYINIKDSVPIDEELPILFQKVLDIMI